MHFKKLVPALALTVAITGCTTNPYTGESQTSKGAWGALAGAATGAAVGALSSSKGDRKKGILTGVAAGAALGGGIGYYMDVQEAKLREKLKPVVEKHGAALGTTLTEIQAELAKLRK